MSWAEAFALVGITLAMFSPVILSEIADIVRAWRWGVTPKNLNSTATKVRTKPSIVVQDICHNEKCPGYGQSLAHKCHDLDCEMHHKKSEAS